MAQTRLLTACVMVRAEEASRSLLPERSITAKIWVKNSTIQEPWRRPLQRKVAIRSGHELMLAGKQMKRMEQLKQMKEMKRMAQTRLLTACVMVRAEEASRSLLPVRSITAKIRVKNSTIQEPWRRPLQRKVAI